MLLFFITGLMAVLFITILVTGGFNLPDDSGGWFYEYQTLIGSFLAGLSILATWLMYNKEEERKRFVARAYLHDALSSICTFAKLNFYDLYDGTKADGSAFADAKNAMDVIKKNIGFLDIDTQKSVLELVMFFQVYNARLEKHSGENIDILNGKENDIYDTLYLYVLSERLFDYARNEKSYLKFEKPTKKQMNSALLSITVKRQDLYTINAEPEIEKVRTLIDEKCS